MMDRIEIKAQLAVDDAGEITGIAWPFSGPDRVGDVIEKMLHRMTHELVERVRAEGRTPVLSTLHLVGEHNRMMDADELKLAVLTVPEGVSPVSPLVLELADDWMRARGLRR